MADLYVDPSNLDIVRRLIRAKDLAEYLSISVCTLWRMTKAKEIPQPIKIGKKMVAWDMLDINDWIAKQKGIQTCNQ